MAIGRALIAGGGIGGLASALACTRAGFEVGLFERAAAFSEVGAGIQLGPNATRVLRHWGLADALAHAAATPARLLVRDAYSGRELGTLPLGERMLQRYGAPYLTLHRADLQSLLRTAVEASGAACLELSAPVEDFSDDDATAAASGGCVSVRLPGGRTASGALLIGADGLWSGLRARLLGDGPPRATGHLAYRALILQQELPERLRSGDVCVWLGRRLHVVGYPVRGASNRALNLVAIVHGGQPPGDPSDPRLRGWDHDTSADDLRAALAGCCSALQDLVHAVPAWRLWALCDRPPMRAAQQHARGRVALVGDAAHPMLPYLAQGAGMAIEDAAELERALRRTAPGDVPASLARFAENRWQRNAEVQARAARNGRIFHASGLLARSRDLSMRLLGQRLLDLPWLYGA